MLLHPGQGRLGGKIHLAERGNIGKTQGNYTHTHIVGNLQGQQAGHAGGRCATRLVASPERAVWEGATATKVSWVRLRISWRLAGAGLSSEARCKETEVCGGRPEAPPQSSASRFSGLPMLVLVIISQQYQTTDKKTSAGWFHSHLCVSAFVPRMPRIQLQCKSKDFKCLGTLPLLRLQVRKDFQPNMRSWRIVLWK